MRWIAYDSARPCGARVHVEYGPHRRRKAGLSGYRLVLQEDPLADNAGKDRALARRRHLRIRAGSLVDHRAPAA